MLFHHSFVKTINLKLTCLLLFLHQIFITTTCQHHQHHRTIVRNVDLRLAHNLIRITETTQPPSTNSNSQQSVQQQPDFTEPIGNYTVALGRDVQLSCKIRNLGNFRTAWLRVEDKGILTIHNNIITRNYRIGLTINDDGKNFVLTIKDVKPSDKGGYMCQINSVPMKYAIGYLDVLTPPIFDDQQQQQQQQQQVAVNGEKQQDEQKTTQTTTGVVTIVEGGNATLTCKASGHPNPVITWRREDNEPILLNGANSEGVTKSEGSSITLNSVSRLSSGAYLCIASNSVQPSASKRQVLDVQFSPVVRLPQTEIGVQLNSVARLVCYIELNPLGSYHWVKLSQQQQQPTIASRQQEQLIDDLSLIEHDELINSDKFEIVIKQVPGSIGTEPNKVQMTLVVRQVERQDFAWYKCIARNSLGIQSNSIRLYESSSSASSSSPFNLFGGNKASDSSNSNNNNNNNQDLSNDQHSRQHLNDQQDSGGGFGGRLSSNNNNNNNKPVLATRTHTRSSWVQRSSSNRPDQPSNALLDASSSSSGAKSSYSKQTLFCHNHILLLLLLSLMSKLYLASPH